MNKLMRSCWCIAFAGGLALQIRAVEFGNWYEASSDKEGVSCAYGDSGPDAAGFFFGANLALSVEGAGKLKPSDIVLTAGTYSAFGTPTILSELEMWREFGQPAQRYFNQKPCVLERDEDGNWANWEAYEDDDDLLYVVSSRIWPKWNPRNNTNWSPADTGRQWILIPLKPADGGPSFRHTFSVSLRENPGVVREISFVKAYDQCIVRFDLDGKGQRIGGGDLVQVVAMDSDDEDDLVPTRATLKAPKVKADAGWRFTGWSPSSLTRTFTEADADETTVFTAQYKQLAKPIGNTRTCEVSFNALQGKVTGGGAYAAGKKVTLKAKPNRGFVFAGWELDGVEVPEGTDVRDAKLSFVMGDEDVLATASFIAAADDWVELHDCFGEGEEFVTGGAFTPVTIPVESGSLAKLKVRGLPAGLRFTAKPLTVRGTGSTLPANTIYGKPARSGVYTVVATATTAGRKTAVRSWTVVVRRAGENVLKAECDPEMGKVTGSGIYAVGRKATLRAKPSKGFVFAGWYDADGNPLEGDVDFRSPSFPYITTGEDVAVWAEFIPSEEDANLELLVDDVYNVSGVFDLTLEIESRSLPKVRLAGLPSGLKFDKKANRIFGTAKKPGTYTVTAKLTNASVKKAVVQTFTIVVGDLEGRGGQTGANGLLLVRDTSGKEVPLLNGNGEKYEISAGVAECGLPMLTVRNAADRLTLSGLPTELKYDAKTGRITGVATKVGTYTVKATVKAGRGLYTSTFTVEVKALPAWAVGTFTGSGDCPIPVDPKYSDNLYGTVTVGANGRLSGKVLYDMADERLFTATFSAPALTGYDAEEGRYYFDAALTFRNGREVVEDGSPRRLYLYPGAYDAEGNLTVGWISVEDGDGFRLDLVQNVWKLKGFADLPAFATKEVVVSTAQEIWGDPEAKGTSTLTLALDPKGTVAVTFVDEGIDFINPATGVGEPFVDTVKTKAEFLVTRHLSGPDRYVALVPIVIPNECTLRAVVELRVSPDGLIRSENCTITECTNFADWTDYYYPDDD